ncbi:venom allergen 3-like [Atheta coriaria]|uniref:venom allergen 3-like n=1 Tax=Dalotia coriaria TaxID=877792 RepID=UPI0031F365ED
MKLTIILLPLIIIGSFAGKVCKIKCPNGEKIYAMGTSQADKRTIVDVHNKYRRMIEEGKVPGQPRSTKMEKMYYDANLGRIARNVTQTCKMEHVIVKDKRWAFVGQNLYIERSSKKCKKTNWETAIKKWFDEQKLYKYPKPPTSKTGHYTQVVAQNTTAIGCDYVFFYNPQKPKNPYTKLYACNYGPAGNVEGMPPYNVPT